MSKHQDPVSTLDLLLKQSKDAEDLVEQCVNDLSVVNDEITGELQNRELTPSVEKAIALNAEIQENVHEASEILASVTAGLETQSRERTLLDLQLAAAQELEDAARRADIRSDAG